MDRIDTVRPDAPDLAPYGRFDVGVRTVHLVDRDRVDACNAAEGRPAPRYDRPLTVEVWYPATRPSTAPTGGTYRFEIRDGATQVVVAGRAVRDAGPFQGDGPYPLVVVSHGYPGNRFLLSHLAENLASKGFVVASVDHTESTYADQGPFAGTLYHRPLDQRFVIDEVERLASADEGFLAGLVDASKTAIVGYSMGGYGAIIAVGGGVTGATVQAEAAPAQSLLAEHQAGSAAHEARRDPRVRAAIAFAPWGMNHGVWDAAGLAGIRTPTLFVAGSLDDVSGYDDGVRAIFEGAAHADRALLTFVNARHNVAAPIPAPSAARDTANFGHYADPVWDTVRMNDVARHFATAFLRLHLHGDRSVASYLDLVPDAADGIWSVAEDGTPLGNHSHWHGFPHRTAVGLRFEVATAAPARAKIPG